MGEWKPIESAPKDGGDVLLASNFGHVTQGRRQSITGSWATDFGVFHEGTKVGGEPCYITHWQPLPDPPKTEGTE